eukprot:254322-Chlamydomonas_euryale.AAC.1
MQPYNVGSGINEGVFQGSGAEAQLAWPGGGLVCGIASCFRDRRQRENRGASSAGHRLTMPVELAPTFPAPAAVAPTRSLPPPTAPSLSRSRPDPAAPRRRPARAGRRQGGTRRARARSPSR